MMLVRGTNKMPESLGYMPLSYREYHPAWAAMAFMGSVSGVGAAIARALLGTWTHPVVIVVLVLTALFPALALFLGQFDVASECRVEGGTLSFRSPFQRRLTQIQIAELRQIDGVYDQEVCWCELAFRDGRRIRINNGPLVQLTQSLLGGRTRRAKFAAAIHAVNPSIAFGKRDGRLCCWCGGRMKTNHFPESCCSECGNRKPQILTHS
jgi:hypothetical protein